jgi:hypothetical protein
MATDRVNILQDIGQRSLTESLPFIETAEGAPVPGAIAGDPNEQAAAFTGRPNRALLKAAVGYDGIRHRERYLR